MPGGGSVVADEREGACKAATTTVTIRSRTIFLSFNLASHVLFSNVRRDTLSTTLLYVFFNQSDHVYHLQESNKNGITDL